MLCITLIVDLGIIIISHDINEGNGPVKRFCKGSRPTLQSR